MDTVQTALTSPVATAEALPPDFYVLQAVRELFKSGWLTNPARMVRNWGMWFGWMCGSLIFNIVFRLHSFQQTPTAERGPYILAFILAGFICIAGPILASWWVRTRVIDERAVKELARQISLGRYDFEVTRRLGWRLWRLATTIPDSGASLPSWLRFNADYLDACWPRNAEHPRRWQTHFAPLLFTVALCGLLFISIYMQVIPFAPQDPGVWYFGSILLGLTSAVLLMYLMFIYPIYAIVRLHEYRLFFSTALLRALPAASFEPELRRRMDELTDAGSRPAVANCLQPSYRRDFLGGFMLLFIPLVLGSAAFGSLLYWLGTAVPQHSPGVLP